MPRAHPDGFHAHVGGGQKIAGAVFEQDTARGVYAVALDKLVVDDRRGLGTKSAATMSKVSSK